MGGDIVQVADQVISRQDMPPDMDPETGAALDDVIARLARVVVGIAGRIARGGIDEELAGAGATNADGDRQRTLDVIADQAFQAALGGSSVRFYASEEQETVGEVNPNGTLALAMDPLDGSSNIDVNVSIGTIFGIYPAQTTGEASFLRPGSDLLAAGYAIYGPQCCLMVSCGAGVRKYVLDPAAGRFHLVDAQVRIPAESHEFSINASNYRHWPTPIRAFVDDCLAGAEGPRGKDFNMRWVASLVAEAHRILTRGGVFLYPRDDRAGYQQGRLRLVYECAPMAFLITQAGGLATDAVAPILAAVPEHLHARTPFVFGTAAKVARVTAYHDLAPQEVSALFGKRGLFREGAQ